MKSTHLKRKPETHQLLKTMIWVGLMQITSPNSLISHGFTDTQIINKQMIP